MSQGRSARLVVAGIGAALGALLIVLAIALTRGVGQPEEGRTEGSGTQAADFTLPVFGGSESLTLSDYAGGPVFIYFWASWCAPCREEAPIIESLWPEYRERGYQFIGVNMWDIQRDAEAFIAELGLSFPLARDAERSVYVEYGVQGLPVGFFLEPGLRVHSRYDGPLDEAKLRAELEAIAGREP